MINSYRRDLLDKEIELHHQNLFGRMLDIGGGTKRGAQVNLEDVSDHITLDNDKTKRPTVIGDAEHLPFKSEVFDSIKCTETLEYINVPENAINEMKRVLTSVGNLMVSTPFSIGIHYDNDLVRFTKHKLERMFNDREFKIVYLSEQGLYFTVLCYMLKQAIMNTRTRLRWVLYWTFPILDLITTLDNCDFVKKSWYLSSFTTGYFISVIKKKESPT